MKQKNNIKAPLKRLLMYVTSTYKVQFFFFIVFLLLSSLAQVAGPLFLMIIIDDVITPLVGQSVIDLSYLVRTILILACVYYSGVISTYIYNRLMVNIGQGVQKRIRDDMFSHMQSLPIRYFDQNAHGEIMSLYTNDIDTLRQMISQSIPMVLSSIVNVVAIFIMMWVLSWHLSLLSVAMILVMFAVVKVVGSKSSYYFGKVQSNVASLEGYLEEMMSGQKVVKVFTHEEQAIKDFEVLNDQLYNSSSQANKYANIMGPIIANLGNIQYVLTAIVGGFVVINGIGAMTLGGMASFLQYTRNFMMPFNQISQQFNSVVMALAGAQRIFNLIDEKPETDDGYVTLVHANQVDGQWIETADVNAPYVWKHPHHDKTTTYTLLQGDVRFFNMSFSYDGKHDVLHDISLYAKPGEKLAFVGHTGAGKTTITNLINRFYDVQDGKIRYDGININKIKKDDLRHSLGLVLQDTHLYTGTIADNIRYGRLDASDEEVIAAAKLANADHFIDHLEEGYQTRLTSDGSQLSQGQRQLISIARAAIADPPVLILDEATSSIDTRTEAIVQHGMDQLMKDRTVFVIAHRLSTVRNSDAIIVLQNGRIIERGDHESLLEEKGIYYQLYTGSLELE